ncbi:MAG: YcjX family protein [Motiliproteus sp.]|nr:YcjX family protein [Motiliproteus sp.]MCW9051662.1 YcjX family protein [Motiliproteus sp.]
MSLRARIDRLVPPEKRQELGDQLQKFASTALDRHVRLAVTGLSQSGKTVFITSLLDHLLSARDSNGLPFFSLCNEDRLLGVKLLPSQGGQEFPFRESMDQLNASPTQWPASTDKLSSIRLAIRYRPGSKVQRMVSETATLYLDIIDYPGEWLLDLPMLQQNFNSWSQQQYRLMAQEPRQSMAKSWLNGAAELDGEAPADQSQITEFSAQYRGLLQGFRRHEQRLSLLQPGRFILPGNLEGSELLQFFPLVKTNSEASQEGSLYAQLEQRFEDYKQQVVEEFYRNHFCHFDRQVVLIDCLKTLNNGRACFDDMQEAVAGILQSFQYGQSGLLRRLFKPRIDRVLFASTKADHVTANQHHNLEQFLELIIQQARRDIQFEGLETRCMAIASYRATGAAEAEVDGQVLSCLKGFRKQNHEPVVLFPGEVPTALPQDKDWSGQRFRFVDFAPPDLKKVRDTPASHIRMDQAIQYLLGDKLR